MQFIHTKRLGILGNFDRRSSQFGGRSTYPCETERTGHTSIPPSFSTMSISKKAYLAEKYMSGPKADAILARTTTKKKKRKADTASSNPIASGSSGFIVDDDASWVLPPHDEDEEDIEDALVVKDRTFKRRKVNDLSSGGHRGTMKSDGGGWTTVQEGAAGAQQEDGSPPPTADELPQIAGVVEDAPSAVSGGLLTKAQLRKKLGPKPAERGRRAEDAEESARQQETVYRDASGRKIDMKAEKAEAARRKREAEEKEAMRMEWGKGQVQREEKERERALMEKERHKGFARHADDAELNEEQKSKELWNDPAAAFLTVCVSTCLQPFRCVSRPHRRSGTKARGDRNTPAQPLRQTVSGSNQDIGGTGSTGATALNRNTFNARTNGNGREQKAIRGAWTTCRVAFPRIYIWTCVCASRTAGVFDSSALSRKRRKGTNGRKYAYRLVDSRKSKNQKRVEERKQDKLNAR